MEARHTVQEEDKDSYVKTMLESVGGTSKE